jgi:hypothetical protein
VARRIMKELSEASAMASLKNQKTIIMRKKTA